MQNVTSLFYKAARKVNVYVYVYDKNQAILWRFRKHFQLYSFDASLLLDNFSRMMIKN